MNGDFTANQLHHFRRAGRAATAARLRLLRERFASRMVSSGLRRRLLLVDSRWGTGYIAAFLLVGGYQPNNSAAAL